MAVGPRADRRVRDGRASQNPPPVNRDARNRASRATVARFRARGGENFREGPRPEKPPTAAVAHFVSSRLRSFARADALERRLTFSFLFSPFSFRRAQIEEERRELDKALRSSVAREKLDGLKRLIGMMSTGRDVSQFFAAVVMNLAQDSFEVKVLVYIYLVRTAEQKADEALLSINSFQKDLAHPNPRVRALALRVMSSIRVDVIVPVVILAVRKCAVDVSPYVRKAAAHAIPKVYRLDKSRQHELVEIIETMLRDSTPFVLSSAVAAFQEVCPDRVDLIHRHFRKICRMLVDMDEWGQILMANLLTRYARAQFVRPDAYDRELTVDAVARGNQDGGERALALALPNESGGAFEKQSSNPLGNTAGFYSDSDSDSDSDASGASDDSGSNADRGKKKAPKKASAAAAAGGAGVSGESYLDDDHRLLLRCSRPLLQSQNAGVVMAVGALHFYLAPVADLPKTLRALVFAMRCKPESQHVMLKNICTMVAVQPSLFQTHFNSFFVHPADPNDVRALKLEILTHVCTAENAPVLLRELQAYLRSGNDHFVALTIRAIGRCAAIMPQIASVCVRSLLELSLHPSEKVAGEAVVVIRALVQRDPTEHLHVVMRLIRRMEALRSPAARAAVAWLAGGELYVFGQDAEKDEQAAAIMKREKERECAEREGEAGEGEADSKELDDSRPPLGDAEGDELGGGSASESDLNPSVTAGASSGRVPTTVRAIEEGGLDALKPEKGDAADDADDTAHDEVSAILPETVSAGAAIGGAAQDASAGVATVVAKEKKSGKEKKRDKRDARLAAARLEKKEKVLSAFERRRDFFELSFAVLKRSLRDFAHETDTVKLQLLNTACKLYVKDQARAGPVLKHLFELCRVDASVDIRDRARVYRSMFAVGGNVTALASLKKQIVLCHKPAPQLPSPAAQTCTHALGSLSHAVEHKAPGYASLPNHPTVAPPSSVRDQYFASSADAARGGAGGKSGKFYSDSDSDSDSDSYGDSDSGSSAYTESDSDSGDESDSDSSDSDGDGDDDGDDASSGASGSSDESDDDESDDSDSD